jgi:predicted SprT family Zn-dependent metalloprotease
MVRYPHKERDDMNRHAEMKKARAWLDAALDKVGRSHLKNRIRMVWNNKLTRAAGRASYRAMTVELSPSLWVLSPEDEQFDTVTHEGAHLVVESERSTQVRVTITRTGRVRRQRTNGPHDATWKSMHRAMGGSGRATYKESDLIAPRQVRRQQRFLVHCAGCGRDHSISKAVRTKWSRGQVRICRCGTKLGPELARAARLAS